MLLASLRLRHPDPQLFVTALTAQKSDLGGAFLSWLNKKQSFDFWICPPVIQVVICTQADQRQDCAVSSFSAMRFNTLTSPDPVLVVHSLSARLRAWASSVDSMMAN